jgi:hypothetical protein
MREADGTAILPARIEETVQAIAKLHAEHQDRVVHSAFAWGGGEAD